MTAHFKTLVAQATNDRKIRGLVKGSETSQEGSLQDLFGDGNLVITISHPPISSPIKALSPLQGKNLAAALEAYFAQSEQLNTRLWLFANTSLTTGLLLQELPAKSSIKADWERIELLANTVTEDEVLGLDCQDLLYRLFHQEKVRIFDGEPIAFDCACSRLKIETALRILGREELESVLVERGQIEVNCEFCNKHYRFDKIDVEQLLLWEKNIPANQQIRH